MTSRFSNRATGAAAATAIVLLVLLIVLLWTGVGQDYLQNGRKSSPRRNNSEFRVADDDAFEDDSEYLQKGFQWVALNLTRREDQARIKTKPQSRPTPSQLSPGHMTLAEVIAVGMNNNVVLRGSAQKSDRRNVRSPGAVVVNGGAENTFTAAEEGDPPAVADPGGTCR
ncbi:UNVERIFIED_CONTAM: hypothetical protein PYX00_004578 [Menopon gallinae]|uniref:Uncharacterized protein n=1 Tax=Menopon gallinae TaxID=328185 RepID=A0AAW2I4A3_9NEOP